MFYKKTLSVKKGKEEEFEFDMFSLTQDLSTDTTKLKVGQPRAVFNFISADGTLKSGYGFKKLAMPTNETDLDSESEIAIRGNEVKTLWKYKWYDEENDKNCYYIFYYNNENKACYDNLFKNRLSPMVINTSFTNVPFATFYRKDNQDALLLSADNSVMVISGGNVTTKDNVPVIVSCVSHYGKLFAITSNARGKLVYNEDLNVINWSDEKTKDLDFGDPRGDLNKIVSFNDYLYLFRDFGITKVSEYGKDDNFEICHIYQSDSYIYPNTIAETGDKIYFLDGSKIRVFNGSSIKTLSLDCLNVLNGCDNRFAFGECFDGKYYLACRGDYKDGQSVGCEAGEYKNNLLLVIDTITEHVDITRGIDINRLLALTNKFKSKLVACFNGTAKNEIGELTMDGKFFGANSKSCWESGMTDFGYNGRLKRIKSFLIRSQNDAKVTFKSERGEKSFVIKGKMGVQKIRANVIGNLFTVKIEGKGGAYISNFVLTVSCG